MFRRNSALFMLPVIFLAISSAAGQTDMNPDGYYVWNTHEFQQDVSGEGFAMVYQYVNTNNLSLKNYMHGSGNMDSATLISSQQKKEKSVDFFPEKVKIGGKDVYQNADKIYTNKYRDSTITFTEQNEMAYSEQGFAYGTGWYASHPITYSSLLKERTESKNYQAGALMMHQIEYARGFRKDIGVVLNCTGQTNKGDGAGIAQMRLDEEVLQGTVQIKEMLTQLDKKGKASKGGVKNPLILIDENYVGSFKIKKSMNINAAKPKISEAKDWLPCCFGGYNDIDEMERFSKVGEAGIFDCTCRETSLKSYKPAWDGSSAQFPNDLYIGKP